MKSFKIVKDSRLEKWLLFLTKVNYYKRFKIILSNDEAVEQFSIQTYHEDFCTMFWKKFFFPFAQLISLILMTITIIALINIKVIAFILALIITALIIASIAIIVAFIMDNTSSKNIVYTKYKSWKDKYCPLVEIERNKDS